MTAFPVDREIALASSRRDARSRSASAARHYRRGRAAIYGARDRWILNHRWRKFKVESIRPSPLALSLAPRINRTSHVYNASREKAPTSFDFVTLLSERDKGSPRKTLLDYRWSRA